MVWKKHMPVDVIEPIRILFILPIRFYTYLDLKREIKKILKVTHDSVLQN